MPFWNLNIPSNTVSRISILRTIRVTSIVLTDIKGKDRNQVSVQAEGTSETRVLTVASLLPLKTENVTTEVLLEAPCEYKFVNCGASAVSIGGHYADGDDQDEQEDGETRYTYPIPSAAPLKKTRSSKALDRTASSASVIESLTQSTAACKVKEEVIDDDVLPLEYAEEEIVVQDTKGAKERSAGPLTRDKLPPGAANSLKRKAEDPAEEPTPRDNKKVKGNSALSSARDQAPRTATKGLKRKAEDPIEESTPRDTKKVKGSLVWQRVEGTEIEWATHFVDKTKTTVVETGSIIKIYFAISIAQGENQVEVRNHPPKRNGVSIAWAEYTVGSGVIPGLDLAIIGMPLAGEREIYIPSVHAFGAIGLAKGAKLFGVCGPGTKDIPPNANLVMRVKVCKVEPPTLREMSLRLPPFTFILTTLTTNMSFTPSSPISFGTWQATLSARASNDALMLKAPSRVAKVAIVERAPNDCILIAGPLEALCSWIVIDLGHFKEICSFDDDKHSIKISLPLQTSTSAALRGLQLPDVTFTLGFEKSLTFNAFKKYTSTGRLPRSYHGEGIVTVADFFGGDHLPQSRQVQARRGVIRPESGSTCIRCLACFIFILVILFVAGAWGA
ncbi:hypothetical protein ONZ45_g3262 [Pleurotus djamor]|nr:hypothetical protein ONZ45_g3262 [Pleurotus djamor]